MHILVTGASRGIGRGIAIELALHGHNVYITGRTQKALDKVISDAKEIAKNEKVENFVNSDPNLVSFVCDHSNDQEVQQVFDKIPKLDCLINNAFSGAKPIIDAKERPFFQLPIEMWDQVNHVGLRNNYRCCHFAARKMLQIGEESATTAESWKNRNKQNPGLIVNVSSAGGAVSLFNAAYGIGKEAKDRMMVDFGLELEKHKTNIYAFSLWPGPVKTELCMEEVEKDSTGHLKKIFENGESTRFAGKCLAAIIKSMGQDDCKYAKYLNGGIISTADIGRKYGLSDVDDRVIPSGLGVKGILYAAGFRKFSAWVPGWLKMPKWVFALGSYGKRIR